MMKIRTEGRGKETKRERDNGGRKREEENGRREGREGGGERENNAYQMRLSNFQRG